MNHQISEDKIYEAARERVEKKRKFYREMVAYVIISIMLVCIWAFPADGGHQWFWYPVGGWGFFLIIKYFEVFVFPSNGGRAAIEKEVAKMKRFGN